MDFDQNNNQIQNGGSNNSDGQQERRVPEYSFWAEQMPGGNTNQINIPRADNTDGYNFTETETAAGSDDKPAKKKHRVIKFILKAACFGLLAGVGFMGILALYYRIDPEAADNGRYYIGASDQSSGTKAADLKIGSTGQGNVTMTSKAAVSQVADTVMPSIVSIKSETTQSGIWFGQDFSNEASGSGIIVSQTDKELLIATNNHVVEGANKITVTFVDGKEVDAVIKGTDVTADLAVISVDLSSMDAGTRSAIKVAKLGDSDKIKVGEMTVAIGNALGYGQSVTVGYVSAKDRKVEVSDNYSYKTMVLLQTDAAINPGNSGGALINISGEVIGINTIKYASAEVEGMGYAIPISKAIPIINDLMNREVLKPGEQGYLGITMSDVTEDVSKALNLPIGVFVNEVAAGSAAEKAGILSGDIVTKVNGKEITSRDQLKEMIQSIKAGTEIEVTVMRNSDGYKEQTIKVVLGTNPNAAAQ